MLKGVSKILAAAVAVLAIPAASQAASVVLSYTGIQYSASPTFASGVTTVVATPGNTNVLLPNAGLYVRFNVAATVVGDVNPGATAGYADVTQPATLGAAAFGASVTNSVPAFTTPVGAPGAASSAAINGLFASSSSKGIIEANGSIGTSALANLIAGGTLSSGVDASDSASIGRLTIGNGTGSPLFSRLTFFVPAGSAGSSVLSAQLPSTSFAFVTNVTPGADGVAPTYGNRNFGPTDTMTGPGTLTVSIVPEPTSLAVLGLAGAGLMARRRKA